MEKTEAFWDWGWDWGFSSSWRAVLEVLGGLFGVERLGVEVCGGYVASVMNVLDMCSVAMVFLLVMMDMLGRERVVGCVIRNRKIDIRIDLPFSASGSFPMTDSC